MRKLAGDDDDDDAISSGIVYGSTMSASFIFEQMFLYFSVGLKEKSAMSKRKNECFSVVEENRMRVRMYTRDMFSRILPV